MFTLIVLPGNFVSDIWTQFNQLFSDLSPILIMVFGVLVGMTVFEMAIHAFRK